MQEEFIGLVDFYQYLYENYLCNKTSDDLKN